MSPALLWPVLTSRLAGPVLAVAALVMAGLLAAATASLAGHKARVAGLSKDRDAWKAAAGRWEASARGLRSSFAAAEAMRARETARARTAADEAVRACDARVASAQRTARAIESIVTQEVSRDANDCPARGLVPGERLRDALTPAG